MRLSSVLSRPETGVYTQSAARPTAIGNITFLLLSFPFGLIYFLIAIIGLSLSLGTLVIWIGLPLLFITLFAVRGMASMERQMVAYFSRTPLPHQSRAEQPPEGSFLRRLGAILRDWRTWSSLIYAVLKFPLGVVSFVLALTLPLVSGSLVLLPLAYLVNVFVDSILLKAGVESTSELIPYFIEVHGQFDLTMFGRTFLLVPIGLVLWFLSIFFLNGLARGSYELAHALLGVGEAE